MIVKQEARRLGRESKVAFATGSPRPQEKFDLNATGQEVEKAKREGAEYYLASFPRDSYEQNLRLFGKRDNPVLLAISTQGWKYHAANSSLEFHLALVRGREVACVISITALEPFLTSSISPSAMYPSATVRQKRC